MKGKALTPLDQSILALANEFSKIPDYEKKMQDDDLRKVHTFISVGIMGIHDASNMVTTSFIPAANKMVVNTKAQIQRSIFKEVFAGIDYDPNTIQQETIRLGYVFVFHKFEVFVNNLMEAMDNAMGDVSVPLKKYAKSTFDFNPNEWFRNSEVHIVNFISNCTKHQDGLCRLSNSTYSIPKEFEYHSPDEKIIRTTQQFKADIKGLMDSIGPLIQIISGIFMHRAFTATSELLQAESSDSLSEMLLRTAKANHEALIRISIAKYQR